MTNSSFSPKSWIKVDGNACISAELIAELNDACDKVEDEAKQSRPVTVIHVIGNQATDLKRYSPYTSDVHVITQWERALRRLERARALTMGVAEGACSALALEILLATDYRLAGTDLHIRIRGPSGEIWPGMSIYRLVNQIGAARARPHILFGMDMPAARAVELSLVDDVVQDVSSKVIKLANSLRETTADEDILIRRQLLLDASTTSFEDALGVHLAAYDRMVRRRNLSKS